MLKIFGVIIIFVSRQHPVAKDALTVSSSSSFLSRNHPPVPFILCMGCTHFHRRECFRACALTDYAVREDMSDRQRSVESRDLSPNQTLLYIYGLVVLLYIYRLDTCPPRPTP
jgi:hypothetical protein